MGNFKNTDAWALFQVWDGAYDFFLISQMMFMCSQSWEWPD